MRFIFIIIFFLLFSYNIVNAQETEQKPFRVEVGAGLGGMLGGYRVSDFYSGGSFFIEPKYQVSNQLALGFLVDGGAFRNSSYNDAFFVIYCPRTLLTGDYYFKKNNENNKTRHFAGMGLGTSLWPGILDKTRVDSHLILRTGLEKSRFRFTVTLGLTGKTEEIYLYGGITVGYIFMQEKK